MVVRDSRLESFESRVQFYLNLGWLPQGGVAIMHVESVNIIYVQAMIRESL